MFRQPVHHRVDHSESPGGLTPRACVAVAACAFIACGASPVHADVVTANFDHNFLFSYRLDHMPDLDQKRNGLAGDGNYHCSPTAALNLILYAANHGFSDVQPGPAFWQAQENYNTATGLIATMGFFMQTSYNPGDPGADPPVNPSGGTNGSNAAAGLEWYLGNQPDYFVVNQHLTSPGYTDNFLNIAKSVIGGNIGTMSYGRYDILGYQNGLPMVQRDGGHVTSVVRAYRNGVNSEIWVRDPADSGDSLDAQSQFTNRIIDLTELDVVLMDNEDPPSAVGVRVMTALNYDPEADRIAFIDGHLSIRPKTGYSFDSSVTQISQDTPDTFSGGKPSHHDIPLPSGVIFDAMFSPSLHEYLVIAGDPNQQRLYRVNPLNGESRPVPLPATPKLILACANGQHAYLGADGSIRLLSASLDPVAHAPIPTDQLSVNFAKIEFEYKPVNSDSNKNESRIVLASTPARKVLFYPMDLSTPTVREMPTMMSGKIQSIAVDPNTSRVWFVMDEGNTLYGLRWDESGNADVQFLNHSAIVSPTGLDFDDAGRMYVGVGGHVKVFNGNTEGGWDLDLNSPFQNIASAGRFRMHRSSNNYEPAFHNHPRWQNSLSPSDIVVGVEKPDCNADIVIDDIVNVNDLLEVINAWGPCVAGSCNADLDGSSSVDVDDLLEVISYWGPCP